MTDSADLASELAMPTAMDAVIRGYDANADLNLREVSQTLHA